MHLFSTRKWRIEHQETRQETYYFCVYYSYYYHRDVTQWYSKWLDHVADFVNYVIFCHVVNMLDEALQQSTAVTAS